MPGARRREALSLKVFRATLDRVPCRLILWKQTASAEASFEADIEEAELIARITGGDIELYADLVRRHQGYLYQLCLAVLSDPHDAEEAAQVALIKAYKALGRFRLESGFRTWLTRIAINQCKDMLRSRQRRRTQSLDALLEAEAPLPKALVAEDAVGKEGAPRLPAEALLGLSQAERDIIQLVQDEEGISYEDIARTLGLTLDGVKGRLKRARIKLKRWMGQEHKGDAS